MDRRSFEEMHAFNDNAVVEIGTNANQAELAASNDASKIKPAEITTGHKPKADIIDIVKEVPKPIEVLTPVEPQDKPDHTALANDKIVQVKNEANAKAEAVGAMAETKINVPYRADQWSPYNKNGKKVYDRDFLLALREVPKSQKRPDYLPVNIMANDERLAMNSVVPITPRREERGGGGSGGGVSGGGVNASVDKKRSRNVRREDRWSTAPSRNSRTPFTFQRDRLINKAPMMDEPLSSIHMFGNWGRGFNIKTQPPLTNTANMYAALENIGTESDKRPALGGNQRKLKLILRQLKDPLNVIIRNYHLNICTINDCNNFIKNSISPSQLPQLVCLGYSPESKMIRFKIGFLFAHLIKLKTLSLQDYCIGLENVLEEANKSNNPNLWKDVAEFICPVVCVDSETLENFQHLFELLMSKEYSAWLLSFLLSLIMEVKEKTCAYNDYSVPMAAVDPENSGNLPRNTLEDYLNGSCNLREYEQYIKDSISPTAFPQLVVDGYMGVLEKSERERLQTGFFFARLMKQGTISLANYCTGLTSVLEEAKELIFDVINVCDNIAELMFAVLCETVKTPVDLHQLLVLLTENYGIKVLSCLFKMFIEKKSPSIELTTPVELTPNQLERKLKNILEEYLGDCCGVQECDLEIKSSIPPSAFTQMVSEGYISVLERSKTARLRTGYLFAQLIKLGTLSLQDYCVGLEAVLAEANELIIDIPMLWDYVAELISPVLCEGSTTWKTLHKSFEPLVSNNHTGKLLACLFKLIIQDKGPNFLQSSWNSSGFTFADYMAESLVDSYVKENSLEFLLEAGDSSPISQSHSPLLGQSQLTYEEMHEKLLGFFVSNTSFDDIINWIAANVGDRVKENQFIRTLATACFNDSIVYMRLKAEILQGKYSLLHRFVDNNPAYELQCLYALQALINKLEHPQGLLLAICDKLYEENVFSLESFVAWEASKDPAEQEGKRVALKQLTSFFTQLKEADEDSSSSEDA